MTTPTILAVTGHRRVATQTAHLKLLEFATAKLTACAPSKVLTGVALGWDQLVAEACRRLRIPYEAYVPGIGQGSRWEHSERLNYEFLLAKAARVVYVTDGPCTDVAFELRNRRMVDDCTELAAFWSGAEGGTANCLRYAVKVGKPYVNWFPEWVKSS